MPISSTRLRSWRTSSPVPITGGCGGRGAWRTSRSRVRVACLACATRCPVSAFDVGAGVDLREASNLGRSYNLEKRILAS